MFKRLFSLLVVLSLVLAVNGVRAEDNQGAGFGSPNAAENIIKEDAKKKGDSLQKESPNLGLTGKRK